METTNLSTSSNNLVYSKYLEIEQFEDKLIIQDYICPLCTGVYNNPVVDGCGHVFCNECITLSLTRSVYCPISYRDISKDSCHQIPFINSIISKHIINCKNKCGWKKPLNNYQQHLDEECPNILLNCKFSNCKECYLRFEKTIHEAACEWRLIECEFCKINVAFVEMQKHYDICPKIKIACEQDCGLEIERCEFENHVKNVCINTLVDCFFGSLGCATKYKRSEEIIHYDNCKLEHFSVISKCLLENKLMSEKIEKLEETIDILMQYKCKTENILNKSAIIENKVLSNKNMNYGDLPLKENHRESSTLNSKRENHQENHETLNDKWDLLNRKRIKPESQKDLNTSNKKLKNLSEQPINKLPQNNRNLIEDYSESEEEAKDPNSDAILRIDKIGSSDNLQVIGNKVICNSITKNQHKFVFVKINQDYNQKNQIVCWNIIVSKKCGWMGFGLAKRQRVLDNNYTFAGNGNNFDHGCFLISSNGFYWNSNLKTQNNCKIPDFVEPSTGDVIKFKYNKSVSTMEISYNKFYTKLESVSSEKDDLYPCAIMMANGDELKFSLANNN